MRDLTTRYQQRLALIGHRAGQKTAAIWGALDAHNEADIPTFTKRSAPVLTGAKTAAVVTGVAYFATVAQIRAPAVNQRDVIVPLLPREPFIAYWNALKGGAPLDEALQSGLARADAFARNLVVSASRRAGDVVFQKAGLHVAYWNRETDANACPWCEDVATQTYKSAETADFGHDRCGCTPFPIFE